MTRDTNQLWFLLIIVSVVLCKPLLYGASRPPVNRVVIVAYHPQKGQSVLLGLGQDGFWNDWGSSHLLGKQVLDLHIGYFGDSDIINSQVIYFNNDQWFIYHVRFKPGKSLFDLIVRQKGTKKNVRWFSFNELTSSSAINLAKGFREFLPTLQQTLSAPLPAPQPAVVPAPVSTPPAQVTPGWSMTFPPAGSGSFSGVFPVNNWFELVNLSNRPQIIYFYQSGQPYYEFTNFYQAQITIGQEIFSTSEHYFQAQKFIENQTIYQLVKDQPTAKKAFDTARDPQNRGFVRQDWRTDISNPWGGVGLHIMLTGLIAKFGHNPILLHFLMLTNNAIIVENAGQNDNFYGAGIDGTGQNHLGRMLMFLRHVEKTTPGRLKELAAIFANSPRGILVDPSYCQGYDDYNPIYPAQPVMAFQKTFFQSAFQPQLPQLHTAFASDPVFSPDPSPAPTSSYQLPTYNQSAASSPLFGELYKKLYGLLDKVRILAIKLGEAQGMLSRLKGYLQTLAQSVMSAKVPVPSKVDETFKFTMLTCNVLHQEPYGKYGKNAIKLTKATRQQSFNAILQKQFLDVDILCFQEFDPSWDRYVPGYGTRFAVKRASGSYVSLFFDKSKFEIKGELFGLMRGGSAPYNYYQAVLLEHKESKKKVAILTCHYKGGGVDLLAQSSQIIDVMNSKPFSDADVQVVCGDFNTRPGNSALGAFFTNGWSEVQLGTNNRPPKPRAFTARNVKGVQQPDYIDYMWYKGLTLTHASIYPQDLTYLLPHDASDTVVTQYTDGSYYFSDHAITCVTFVLKK